MVMAEVVPSSEYPNLTNRIPKIPKEVAFPFGLPQLEVGFVLKVLFWNELQRDVDLEEWKKSVDARNAT
jgi:hypothetical protein